MEQFTQASLASALWKSREAPQRAGPATGQPALGWAILPLCSAHPGSHGQFWAPPYKTDTDTLEHGPAEATTGGEELEEMQVGNTKGSIM